LDFPSAKILGVTFKRGEIYIWVGDICVAFPHIGGNLGVSFKKRAGGDYLGGGEFFSGWAPLSVIFLSCSFMGHIPQGWCNLEDEGEP